jgi:hypothetical protein
MFGGLDKIKFFLCEILLFLVVLLSLIILLFLLFLLSLVVLLSLIILLFLLFLLSLIVLFGLLLLLFRNWYWYFFCIAMSIAIIRLAYTLYFLITISISRRINTIRCMCYKFLNNLLPKYWNLHNFLLINNNLFLYFFNNLYWKRYFFIFNSFNKNRLNFTISFL